MILLINTSFKTLMTKMNANAGFYYDKFEKSTHFNSVLLL